MKAATNRKRVTGICLEGMTPNREDKGLVPLE